MSSYFFIENETASIDCIKNVLDDFKGYTCIGSSDQYDEALNLVLKEAPDLVFLNIDNVIEKPFTFVKEITLYSEIFPAIIAISSSKKKAYDVIKNGFFDFILIPLTDLEIRKSILNFQKKNLVNSNRKICLKSYKDYQYLNAEEILFLKADNNTTDFYMSDNTIISAFKTLKTFEELLPENFLRIHKSYIINKNHVSRIQYGKLMCSIKKNNFEIPFTKTYIENIEIIKKTLSRYSYRTTE